MEKIRKQRDVYSPTGTKKEVYNMLVEQIENTDKSMLYLSKALQVSYPTVLKIRNEIKGGIEK